MLSILLTASSIGFPAVCMHLLKLTFMSKNDRKRSGVRIEVWRGRRMAWICKLGNLVDFLFCRLLGCLSSTVVDEMCSSNNSALTCIPLDLLLMCFELAAVWCVRIIEGASVGSVSKAGFAPPPLISMKKSLFQYFRRLFCGSNARSLCALDVGGSSEDRGRMRL